MTQMEKDIHEIAKAITKIANKDNIKVNNEIIDKLASITEKYLVEVKDIDKPDNLQNDDTDMPLERTESLSTDSDLVNAIGVPAMLEQTGEEASELAQACLKLARYYRGENKVYGKNESELKDNLAEEIADVNLCIHEIVNGKIIHWKDIDRWYNFKVDRKERRLKENENDENDTICTCDGNIAFSNVIFDSKKDAQHILKVLDENINKDFVSINDFYSVCAISDIYVVMSMDEYKLSYDYGWNKNDIIKNSVIEERCGYMGNNYFVIIFPPAKKIDMREVTT